ncbi:DUF3137 domain-containing protein [Bacteroides helcogenes]|uniref:DUF3137 domain-containing protein n=1 Tax=Bacteroides helcogenes (strain ATCC 35417 / DSM 20613 / JCM 6297 / CCUG 15421 / P 36-108) TaxID=693979 RepID=E6SNC0_BACT6|nr:DUF3137 domain-containing protein [Bacteroides helcogenes]ADV42713.1 hypothetical protein Bache_0690 [Bacteroides helcogenes P 36-108]MDY5239544.1 DUF3137 domain-containing protein [Bacteroides helcogenes]
MSLNNTAAIEATLAEMEQRRRASIFPAIWQGAAIGVGLGLLVGLFVGAMVICMVICVPCGIWAMFYYKRSLLSAIYKSEIMPRLVATLGEGVTYSPEGGIGIESFRNCHLFDVHSSDRCSSEDCVSGRIGKTAFVFSEASYSYVTKDSDDEDQIHTEFSGIGYQADFNKHFKGITLLCSKRPGHLSKSEYPEVKLESPAFGKLFSVYSTDEVEARYILSPALQERFVKLTESIRQSSGEDKVKIAFYDSWILILIQSSKNRFEAKILSPLKLERVQQDLEVLQGLGRIVEELNLNTRIWSKQ